MVVFSKTKEPIEVPPAANIATTTNEQEEKESLTSTSAVGIKEEQKEEIELATKASETQTEENIVEVKSTTISIAQIYKNSEEKTESHSNATTNSGKLLNF